jgi:hypothetical protein
LQHRTQLNFSVAICRLAITYHLAAQRHLYSSIF